ncbi:hypothetical protein EBR21_05625 [bacterium]|nr:hypothetical protein [bacterium]
MKNPSVRRYSNNSCVKLARTSAFVMLVGQMAACTTTTVATPPTNEHRPATEKMENQTTEKNSAGQNSTSGSSIPFVTQFEGALAKRDCAAIRSLESQLIAPPESYANSVILATAWCAHQKSPEDSVALAKFVSAADKAIKLEAPLFSPAFIEQLKGESYSAAGDNNSARASFGKSISVSALQFMSFVSGPALKNDLQSLEPMLTGAQSSLLKEIRTSLTDSSTQSVALNKMDELLSQLPPGGARDRLLASRLRLFSALELTFASQLSTLEETRMKGNTAALEEETSKIRKLFPGRPHQMRIDSITGTATSNKTAAVDPSTAAPGNQCNTLTPTAVLNSNERYDLSSDKALQLAKMALNEGKPGDAVDILDGLSEANKSEKTRGLRREASEAHVKDMRRKASEIYKKVAIIGDPQGKLDTLSQCKQILESILSRYPDTDSYTRRNIQKFLNSVSDNISELKKGQVK